MNPTQTPRRVIVPFLAAGALFLVPGAAQAADVNPTLLDGNPSCADLGYPHEIKFDPPAPGSKSADGVTVDMSLGADQYGTLVDWTSSAPIDAVIVKGGPNALSYVYAGESSGDTGLHTPFNGPDKYYGLSHVNFCWDDQTPPPDDKTPPPGDDTPPPPGDKTPPPPGDTPPPPAGDQPPAATPPAVTPPAVPSAGVLAEQARSGVSRMRGPSGCAGRTVKAKVSGRAIKTVTFTLDGKRVKRISGAGSYSVRSATLSAGIHRIKAKVTFKAAAHTKSRTHLVTFHRCVAKQVAPRFAG